MKSCLSSSFVALLTGVVLLVSAGSAWADTETVNGLTWTYKVSDGTASVGGEGYYSPAVPRTTTGAIEVPATLGGYPVTSVGNYAFSGCTGLTDATIPDSVTSIGYAAFTNCTGLTSIMIPDSVTSVGHYAFSGCRGLTNAAIGDSVTSIGNCAFSGCTSLARVTILGNVTNNWTAYYTYSTTIPFDGCTNLSTLVLGEKMTEIGSCMFRGCRGLTNVAIPNGVTNIGNSAFLGCEGLECVTIPDSVTRIGRAAFLACTEVTAVRITDLAAWCGIDFADETANPVSYASHLYLNETEVTDLVIPDGVASIGEHTFSWCTGLTRVSIPDSVTNIGDSAFSQCTGLAQFAVSAANPSYAATDGVVYDKAKTTLVAFPAGRAGTFDIPDGVTNIGRYAFRGCTGLTNVSIPDSVTNIGDSAFSECTNLTSVVLPASVAHIGWYAFDYCSGLTNAMISGNVTNIGYGTFRHCTKLTSVTIPDRVTRIAEDAFKDCTNVTSIVTGDGLTTLAGLPIYPGLTNIVIGKRVTSIDEKAFYWCTGLTSVTIGNGVKSIGTEAFYWCTHLTTVTIPNSVTSIGDGAFSGCSGLTSVVIPNSVTSIGDWAFSSCSGLTSVVIPDGVTRIGNYAFRYCSGLTNVVIGNGVTRIGNYAFCYCSGLTNVTIGNGVTSIGEYAFSSCTGLPSVTIPDSVTNIGTYAFSECRGLTNVVFGNGVTSIGEYAFEYCTKLPSMAIPDSVTTISGAFNRCTGLALLEVPLAWRGTTMLANAGVPNGCQIVYRGLAVETVDGVEWGYVVEGDTAVVVNGEYAGELSVPGMLGGYPVARIGTGAFSTCTNLTALVIPDGVTGVDSHAFAGCTALSALEVPAAWYGTTMLANTGVPTGCTVTYRGIEMLAVATEELPAGRAGAPYASPLVAEGGRAPYTWLSVSVGGDYMETVQASTYEAAGWTQGWQGDDVCWDLPLPFAFPFFGKSYTNAKINSNGAISFGSGSFTAYSYSQSTFLANPIIAAMWKDLTTSSGDIYVQSGPEAVTIRWSGVYYNGGAVDFAATLRADGTIVLSYGNGNASGGFVGISAGDGTNYLVSAKSNSDSLANAADIVFAPPTVLPAWLELTTDGVLQGTPTEAGEFTFTVVVTDDAGTTASKELTLTVESDGDAGEATATTPVPVPHAWLDENAADILAANGGDHEAAAKAPAANGRPLWECYVAGLSTTNAAAAFKLKSISFADGEPVIEWDPDLNAGGTKADRTYVEEGKASMADEWGPRDASSRFFRVRVGLPE